MILAPSLNLIVLHIPKTGGTALCAAIAPFLAAQDSPPNGMRKHARWEELLPHLSPEFAKSAQVFTLVRNPWDRAISYYTWLRGQTFAHPAVTRALSMDFSGFLADQQTQLSFQFSPYGAWLRHEGHERACHFIRLEHLAQDILPLTQSLGAPVTMTRKNASDRHPDWRRYYGAKEADIIAKICADDIARFGYGFDDYDAYNGA